MTTDDVERALGEALGHLRRELRREFLEHIERLEYQLGVERRLRELERRAAESDAEAPVIDLPSLRVVR